MPKKGYKWPNVYKENRSTQYSGSGNPFFNKKHSKKTKSEISNSRTGKKYDKLSLIKKIQNKGTGNPMYGKKHSDITKEKIREKRLQQIFPTKDTKLEIKIQTLLNQMGIKYETHYPIFGQPDIFIYPNIAVFCDGCYWHKCEQCGFGFGNKRDDEVNKRLNERGYKVIRVWEHEVKNVNNIKIYDLLKM